MSSFQDNFHREEEKALDYDDSAFYYFSVAILTVIIFPVTIMLIRTMLTGEKQIDLTARNCECARCKALIKERQAVLARSWMRPGFYTKIVLTLLLWVVYILTVVHVSQIEPLKSFDPYQILDIDSGADLQTIKKAYRKLSLLKHPDRNPDDPLAATEFILITKAYTSLTDETAKANYEKYGNPDGPGSFQVAIALPRFLLNKDYQIPVLAGFFIVLLILVPAWFYFNLNSQNTEVGDISVDNMRIFAGMLSENLIYKNCPTILACSEEFRNIKPRSKDAEEQLKKIRADDATKELIPLKPQGRLAEILNQPTLLIVLAFMLRMNELNESLQEDL